MDAKIIEGIYGWLEHPQHKMGITFLAHLDGVATFEQSEFVV